MSMLVKQTSFVIWHDVRYGRKPGFQKPSQTELDFRWSVCAKSNVAASRKSECQIRAPITTRALMVDSHDRRSLQLPPKMYYYASPTLRSETMLPLKKQTQHVC